ncbi:hypothetical protein L484_017138 [Morus notabilis]|uniref:Uncharacterized protein n=1 Tax=Morus notabilis TaxID=981085 RepID=W9QTF8_9ROSA|nr:hypothetical protein L484_017138 [Morus notabilis]
MGVFSKKLPGRFDLDRANCLAIREGLVVTVEWAASYAVESGDLNAASRVRSR